MTHESLINECEYILQGLPNNFGYNINRAMLVKELLKIYYNKETEIIFNSYDEIIATGNVKIQESIEDIKIIYHNLKIVKTKLKNNEGSLSHKIKCGTGFYIKLLEVTQ